MTRKFIDMHCDTISELQKSEAGESLLKNHLCVHMEGMEKAGTMIQFFACFANGKDYVEGSPVWNAGHRQISPEAWDLAYGAVLDMIRRIRREENEKLRGVRSYEEIQENVRQDRISTIATVEEGGVLNGRAKRLEELYREGIRLITLTWNYENCLGYPNSRDSEMMNRGLKAFGLEMVERMNALGMLVDVSHLSDDMLRALAEKGGVAGLNFYPVFLREEVQNVTVQDIACHAAHMIDAAGEELPAIGTDFDGFVCGSVTGYLRGPADMEQVWEAMKKQGITERQMDKIWSENALRVLKEVL